MRVRGYGEVLNEQPSAKRGWKPIVEAVNGEPTVTGFASDGHGEARMVFACGDDGKPIWDQLLLKLSPLGKDGARLESAGAVIVPYYKRLDAVYVGMFDKPMPIFGRTLTTVPMGFTKPKLDKSIYDTAHRELVEETSLAALDLYDLGKVSVNAAFSVTRDHYFAAKVDPYARTHAEPDPNEEIRNFRFLRYPVETDGLIRRRMEDGVVPVDGESLISLALFGANVRYLP